MKKTALLLFLASVSIKAVGQDTDTLKIFDHRCVSSNPFEIDTTYFTYRNDSLFIRNIRTGFCCPLTLIGIRTYKADTMLIQVKNPTDTDCLCDCSYGYTIGIPDIAMDQLVKLEINGEYFEAKMLELDLIKKREGKDLIILPNPTEGNFTIGLENGNKLITIFDQNGKQVYQTETFNKELKLTNLLPGIYEIRVEMSGQLRSGKLIIR